MAAKIDYQIPESNQELIRDRIGLIIKEELDNQALLQTDPELTAEVYIERYTPIDKSELRVVVVGIDNGNFEDQTSIHQKADFKYYIDVYTVAKQNDSETGYLVSSKKLQRLAGLIRSIIQAPVYQKLGFNDKANPVIYRRSIQSMNYDLTNGAEDATFFRMVRINLNVEFHEEQPEQGSITASGYDTEAKLNLTDKGYKWTVNN